MRGSTAGLLYAAPRGSELGSLRSRDFLNKRQFDEGRVTAFDGQVEKLRGLHGIVAGRGRVGGIS